MLRDMPRISIEYRRRSVVEQRAVWTTRDARVWWIENRFRAETGLPNKDPYRQTNYR
jgi:hypothetical protein